MTLRKHSWEALYLSCLLVILYAPVIVVVVQSFNSAERGMRWSAFTLGNYRSFVASSLLLEALYTSFQLATLVTVVSIFFGCALGYCLAVTPQQTALFILSTGLVGVLMPDLFIALANSAMFRSLGLTTGLWSAGLVQAVVGTSYVAVLILARARSIDLRGLMVAAESLGASEWNQFRDIFLRLVTPALLVGGFTVFALAIQDFIYPFFLGGSGATTLSVRIYGLVRRGVNPEVSVAYVVLFLIVVAFLAVSTLVVYRRSENAA